MRVATSAAAAPPRSRAFAALSPTEKLARLQTVYPRKAAAIVEAMDHIWETEERQRRSRAARQARATLKPR
ncbi:MAG TPA: hypothetical protein VN903_29930 [Polyangia bacterium]|nr:hypothetical protein [Polyangia bacterium]